MKFILLFAALVSTHAAFAETSIYEENNKVIASLDAHTDAKKLYTVLKVSETEARSGKVKVFNSTDKKATIYCYKSKIPVGLPYGCTLSIDIKNKAKGTVVKLDGNRLFAHLTKEDSKALFKALNVPAINGFMGASKIFSTSDDRAAITCSFETNCHISMDHY